MERSERKKLKKKKKRRWLIPLIVFVLAVVGYGGYLTFKLANATSKANEELERGGKSEKRDEAVNPAKDNFSVLFVGIDEREKGGSTRSDALILATFNKNDKSVKMVSIPRDTYVEIPGREGKDKINHAFAFGGMDLTVATIENFFNVPVDYYVKLNFNAFMDIVDHLGGVEVNVPFSFTTQDSKDRKNAIKLEKGVHTLNGEEALGFVRMRKQDPTGDLGRGDRQKELITAILEKTKSPLSIPKYDNIIDSVGDNMKTNFTFGNIIALQRYAGGLGKIEQLKLEGHDLNLNAYYYEVNEDSLIKVSNELQEHLDYKPQ